jgi:hypothetical protein
MMQRAGSGMAELKRNAIDRVRRADLRNYVYFSESDDIPPRSHWEYKEVAVIHENGQPKRLSRAKG